MAGFNLPSFMSKVERVLISFAFCASFSVNSFTCLWLAFFFFLIHLLLMNKDFDICYNIFWSYLFLTLFIDVFLLSCIEVL